MMDWPNNALQLSRGTDPQLHAVEYLLNDLSAHGLLVSPTDDGQWLWEWQGQRGFADGLGIAVMDALYWYFGLSPDVLAVTP